MSYIPLKEGVPGIRSLALFRPETGRYLYDLTQVLLRGESTIPVAERELIAAYVSSINHCKFCTLSHAAASRELFGEKKEIVDCVLNDFDRTDMAPKLRALLLIAGKVAESGKSVKPEDIDLAREYGANDRDIHDTVLIAAAFCMLNRYVDGLGSFTPQDPAAYKEMGVRMASRGYILNPTQ